MAGSIDLLILLGFVAYAVASGFRNRKAASQDLEQYFLAGRSLGGWKAGTSMAATQFSADTPLFIVGLVAVSGIFELWRFWVYSLSILLMGFLLATSWRRALVLTDAEVVDIRYSGRPAVFLRGLKAFYYGTVINCIVLAIVLTAAMRVCEVFLPWHSWLPPGFFGMLEQAVAATGLDLSSGATPVGAAAATTSNLISLVLIIGFTTLYSTTGGLRSVVNTDLMQFGIAMLGIVLLAIFVVAKAGGLGAMVEQIQLDQGEAAAARILSFAPPGGEELLPFLVLMSLQWLFQMNSDGTGYLAQRTMACRDDREARKAAVWFAWIMVLVRNAIWLVIAVGLVALYPDPMASRAAPGEDFEAVTVAREMFYFQSIDELLPIGIRGLLLTSLLAALCSTLDTHLNWGASYWSNDLYKRVWCQAIRRRDPGNHELVLVAKGANLLLVAVALLIMSQVNSITTAWILLLTFGAGMGSVLVMRWLWERINLYSEFAAIGVSLTVAPALIASVEQEWLRIATMAVVSTGSAILVTFVTPRTSDAVLRSFYQRIHPVGLWDRAARLAGDPPKQARLRFREGLAGLLSCATSLLAAVYGVGKLLVHLPGENLWPAFLCLLAALALLPVWWRHVARPPA